MRPGPVRRWNSLDFIGAAILLRDQRRIEYDNRSHSALFVKKSYGTQVLA
jgi:hypothetical protein